MTMTNTSAGVGSTSITTLGTVTTGIWNGSTIVESHGGTNQSTYILGDILYASASNTLSKLAKNTTATRYLANTGTSNIPNWDQINLTNGVTGLLAIANGGTNVNSVTTSPTASSFAGWDANSNLSSNNYITGYATIATSGGTTTLTVASAEKQYFTGTTTQTVKMPVTSTLKTGQSWTIVNNSTGSVTVQSSGANNIVVLAGGTYAVLTCILTSGTTAASWNFIFSYNSGGSVTAVTGSGNIASSGGTTPNITFTGQLPLANGGTNAALTASNGGIFYSTASAGAILAGTSTANQLLVSGAATTPSWTSNYKDYGSGGGTAGDLFIGTGSGPSTLAVGGNTGVGVGTLASINTTSASPSDNTAIGYASSANITTGFSNTTVGSGAGYGITTGYQNTFIGYGTANSASASANNIFIGVSAGSSFGSYNGCILIGNSTDCSGTGLSNAIAIGNNTLVGASNCMVLGTGLNVGIGTSTPTSLLTLGSTTTAPTTNSILNSYSTTQNISRFSLTGNSYWSGGGTSTEGVSLYLGYNSSGNRQIGFLDSSHAKNSTNVGLRIGFGALTYSNVWIGAITTDGSTPSKALTIESSLLYSTTDTVTKPTAGSWTAASDIRIKENIKKYMRGLSEVLMLNPVEYQLNEDSGYPKEIRDKVNQGLIANEVEEIMPECVGRLNHRDLGEIRSLDITPITYALINAIKEINSRLILIEKAA